jgi:hypothetical protein
MVTPHMTIQDLHAANAVMAMAGAVPDPALKSSLLDAIQQALKSLPWLKIMQAVAMATAGGFTPASIQAAIAILLGTGTMGHPDIAASAHP